MKVIFACAGTGGHINPAIAIANKIVEEEKDSSILFLGTKNGLENELVKKAGYEILHVRTGKILRSFTLKNIKAMYNAYRGIGDAKKIIKKFNPDVVIGTGGYICVPVMLAAKKMKIPYILHEANAFPGMAVKLLSKDAAKVFLGFKEAKDRIKHNENAIYTGTPAKFNSERIEKLDLNECKRKLGIDKINKKIVLVTCGSQGARKINNTVLEMIKKHLSDKFYVILVTGENNYDDVMCLKKEYEKEVGNLDKYIKIEKFVFEMDMMYKVADVCITRAGALTVTELSIAAKPAILIPLPYATENHQLYNAKVLSDVNAAKIIEEKNFDSDMLYNNISGILYDDKLKEMSRNAKSVVNNKVIEKIYDAIIETVKK